MTGFHAANPRRPRVSAKPGLLMRRGADIGVCPYGSVVAQIEGDKEAPIIIENQLAGAEGIVFILAVVPILAILRVGPAAGDTTQTLRIDYS